MTPDTSEIARVFAEDYGRAVAVLVRVFGDIDIAEEAVQDAFTIAVQRWPSSGGACTENAAVRDFLRRSHRALSGAG
ncbi:hypothetical protein [Streptosporangium sp. NPDC006930]|uniref:hypothetical protein n=1 Tax=unclassified Streptosporangium TaxID=2632669 RepID=UPI00341D5BBC